MKAVLLVLFSVATMAEPLPRWIAVVPVYPNPNLFDPHMTVKECGMFGNMAGAVQIVRRDSRDDLVTFLIRMPIELRRDNFGFQQPIISHYYTEIGAWVYSNYRQEEPVINVQNDYTMECLRQGMPSDMEKWFELKKREESEQEEPSWGA